MMVLGFLLRWDGLVRSLIMSGQCGKWFVRPVLITLNIARVRLMGLGRWYVMKRPWTWRSLPLLDRLRGLLGREDIGNGVILGRRFVNGLVLIAI